MKRLILLSLFIFSAWYCKAEQPYQPWETFQGDTLRYLTVNFEENKERYIGQPFEKVLNDYELFLGEVMTLPDSNQKVKGSAIKYTAYKMDIPLILNKQTVHYLIVSFRKSMFFERLPMFNEKGFPEKDARVVGMKMKDAIVEDIKIETYP